MDFEALVMKKLNKKAELDKIVVFEYDLPAYFYPQVHERYNYIRMRLTHMKPRYLELLKKEEFKPINHISSELFYTFGMVMSPTGSKLVSECFLINTEDESNTAVRLNIEGLNGYSLFCGQVVALKARNAAGNELIAERVYFHPIIQNMEHDKTDLNAVFISGPLTSDQISFLFQQAHTLSCRSVVILGPFSTSGSFSDFTSHIKEMLSKYPAVSVVLVPSLLDREFLKVLPQPGMKEEGRLEVTANPSCFSINGHTISAVNYDLITQITDAELYKPSPKEEDLLLPDDPLSRASNHIVFQQSYIPVFPSFPGVIYGLWGNVDAQADVIVIRSNVPGFVRISGKYLLVNVGDISGCGVTVGYNGSEYNTGVFSLS